jgi:uncharacterized protein YggE
MRLAVLGLSLALAGAAPFGTLAAQGPAATPPLAAGEMLLEVNALGNVTARADRATMTVVITADGATEAEARRDAEAKVRRLTAALRAAGVAEADIRTRPVSTTVNLELVTTVDTSMDMADAPANAAAAVVEDSQPPQPSASASASMEIVVRDLGRIEAVQAAFATEGMPPFAPTTYALNDASVPRRLARAQALRTARADAEAYAAALNMRVVRIVRVTERIGLDGLGLFISEADSLARLFGPMGARGPEIPTMVAVGVDFALAPR